MLGLRELIKSKKRIKNYGKKVKGVKDNTKVKKIKLNEKAYDKAHQKVSTFSYRPTNTDIIVHTLILLVPK